MRPDGLYLGSEVPQDRVCSVWENRAVLRAFITTMHTQHIKQHFLLYFAVFTIGMVLSPAVLSAAVPTPDSLVDPGNPACIPAAAPPCFTSVQAALTAADALVNAPTSTWTGYTIMVEPGTYNEAITLKPHITLQGRETARTVLTAGGTGTIVAAIDVVGAALSNFTLTNAAAGVFVSGNSSVSITNNIFFTGPGGAGIRFQNTQNAAGLLVINNTFIRNAAALVRDADIRIANNLFSDNSANISDSAASLGQVNISFNAFYPAPFASEPTGTIFLPNALAPGADPLFADPLRTPPEMDLHLVTGSPCINKGTNVFGTGNSVDGFVSDLGAFGGPRADTLPFPLSGVFVDAPDATTIVVSWQGNAGYQVGGYRVWYGRSPGLYTGDGALEGTSPILTQDTIQTLSDLSTVVTTTLAAPALGQPQPLNKGLLLTWPAVPGATAYKVYYSTSPFDELSRSSASSVVVEGGPPFALSGLTNGEAYYVAVVVFQPDYVIAVTAINTALVQVSDLVPGQADESAYSAPVTIRAGAPAEGLLSAVLSSIPEASAAFPGLPNTKNGCFIATAVYGSSSAPEVRTLRVFRDRYLLTNGAGRAFVRWYYEHGPAAAAYLDAHPGHKPLVRAVLLPAVATASFLTRAPLVVKAYVVAIVLLYGAVRAFRRARRSDLAAGERR